MTAWLSMAAVVGTMIVGPAALGSTQEKPATKPESADSSFLKTAAMAGMAEVEYGRLAGQNAGSGEVKQFGQRMVDDHGKALAALKSLAAQKSVTLPTELDAKHKESQTKLSKLNGPAFDSAYMAHMVTAHKEALALFQREAKTGTDAETKAFAENTVPTVQEHLKMAQDLNAKNKSH